MEDKRVILMVGIMLGAMFVVFAMNNRIMSEIEDSSFPSQPVVKPAQTRETAPAPVIDETMVQQVSEESVSESVPDVALKAESEEDLEIEYETPLITPILHQ